MSETGGLGCICHVLGRESCPQHSYAALERALALAIAHDRQPYPTAWAYEQACRVRDELREEVAGLERELQRCQEGHLA